MKSSQPVNRYRVLLGSLLFTCYLFLALPGTAQWEVNAAAGPAFPITGFGRAVGTGYAISLEGLSALRNRPVSIGFVAGVAHFGKDRNSQDGFADLKLTVIPLLAKARVGTDPSATWSFHAGFAMGPSLYSTYYVTTVPKEEGRTNASFSFEPSAGLSVKVGNHLRVGAEGRSLFMTDGPPAGFAQSDRATGYWTAALRAGYRF